MADLNFPVSPVNGQTYTSGQTTWTYDAAFGVWNITSSGPTGYTGSKGNVSYVGDTPPSTPEPGDTWYNSADGIRYVYYNDGSSSQWVQETTVGPRGDTGYVGSKGDLGYTGSIGYTGSQGPIGYTGSQGDTGSIGYTGSQGPIGYTGSTPGASPTFTGSIYNNGSVRSNIVSVSALDIDCSSGNYFTKSVNASSTFTFSNAPSGVSYSFTLEVNVTGTVTLTWPASVKWPGNTTPTLEATKTHLFVFVTDDAATTWRAGSLVNYVT